MQEFVAINSRVSEEDKELFLGPLQPGELSSAMIFESNHTLAHILVAAGKFPSVTQAKKDQAGKWDQLVPPGFSMFVVGKNQKRTTFYILNQLAD